jgi:hypothetical protein
MCRHRSLLAVQTLLVCLILVGAAQAQGPLESVSVTAHPQSYTGTCPATITFEGVVGVSRGPMVFQYQWERSDRAQAPQRMYRVPGPGARRVRLMERWQLGGPRRSMEIWMRLRVASGNTRLLSEPARVSIQCR